MSSTLQYSLCTFVIISVVISLFLVKPLKTSKKKHLMTAIFIFLAAFIHAFFIFLTD